MDTKENWERVQSLFLRAMEMSPADRVALLDSACAGQPELRCEVESLIAHDGGGVHEIALCLRRRDWGTARCLARPPGNWARGYGDGVLSIAR